MKDTRIVGIDFGLKRIGIASSDLTKTIAFPLSTIQTGKKLEDTVALLVQELEKDQKYRGYALDSIVVGMPFLMNGTTGFMADEVEHFIAHLKEKCSCPILKWDERLSSVQADRSLREANLSRKSRSQKVDSVAAVIILQNYLDRIKES